MPLTVEEDITAFLGIQVKSAKNTILLSQPGLIKQVLDVVGLHEANVVYTPAVTVPLGSDIDGSVFKEEWGYSSVVGMLLFLANNTRPDIAFTVHQCVWFTHAPRKSHGIAVKRIVRDFRGTAEYGMILTPTSKYSIDCYVDADFARLFGVENPQDPISVKIHTGYILYIVGCPVLWVSKLQTEMASSTMEAE